MLEIAGNIQPDILATENYRATLRSNHWTPLHELMKCVLVDALLLIVSERKIGSQGPTSNARDVTDAHHWLFEIGFKPTNLFSAESICAFLHIDIEALRRRVIDGKLRPDEIAILHISPCTRSAA